MLRGRENHFMARQVGLTDSITREIVDELFVHPPVNEPELAQRIDGVDKTVARRLVIDQLDVGKLSDRSGPLFLAILGQIKIGRQKRRLTRIALDLNRNLRERLWAAMALTAEDPKTMDYLVDQLGPEGMSMLAELSLIELLTMQESEDIGASISDALENLIDDRPADELLGRIESCRLGIGISCAVAYGDALKNKNLTPLHRNILDLFILEASDEGSRLLETLRDSASTDTRRRDFQATLLRLRSNRIDPKHVPESPPGYGLVSNCDSQGSFVLLGVFENPDMTFSVADFSIHAGGDIRDSAFYPRCGSHEIKRITEDVQGQLGCFFVEVTLFEAGELVATGVQRTVEYNKTIPEEMSPALTLFDRIKPGFKWGDGACCLPAREAPVKKIHDLLNRPEYEDTWFFDIGDLKRGDVTLPDSEHGLSSWVNETAERLDKTPIKTRIVAMAEHMARWHFWNMEPDVAALLRRIAENTRQNFPKSDIVSIMLNRSFEIFQHQDRELTHHFGDPKERQYYKKLFFQSLTDPTGTNLAQLDYTEAAATALDNAFDLLPGELRPRDDEKDAAAFAIGKAFANDMVEGKTPKPEQTVSQMSKILAGATRLSESERHEVLMTVVPSLYAFVDEICSTCPIRCLDHPDENMSDIFFTPNHPISYKIEDL